MSRNNSRREFLRRAGLLSLLGASRAPFALNLLSLSEASAQSSPTGYKALVCLFLNGGNDSFNTVLATDDASWSAYTAARSSPPDYIGLNRSQLLPIVPTTCQGRSFALHPKLAKVQELFALKRLAIVANVGPLLLPTTKSQYASPLHPKPSKMFSHSDQLSTWQAFQPEGNLTGWGGRLGDLMLGGNGGVSGLTCVSASGNSLWLSGQQALQYQVGILGPIRLGSDASNRVYGSTQVASALERITGGSRSGNLLEADIAAVARRSMDMEQLLRTALPVAEALPYGSAPFYLDPLLQYDNPQTYCRSYNPLAHRFQVIARMISAGQSLGLKRQVFFVDLASFDTHQSQNRDHPMLLAQVNHALGYFDGVLGGLGLRNQVTTFTASEFGRNFTSNGQGSDHGWGGHHFVMGGAVRGGEVYGRFPTYSLRNGEDFISSDLLSTGAMVPALSVDQYAATLARWFDVSDTNAELIFPNLTQFSARDLGFMAAVAG